MARRISYILLIVCLLAACSTTKNIPDDDRLFVGLKSIDYRQADHSLHATATKEEVEAALATAPNGALFGSSYYRSPLPYGLWIWNAYSQKDTPFAKWLVKSFATAPVLMSQVNPALRASVAQSVLRKNGYFHGKVDYEKILMRNQKKMKLAYHVDMDSLTLIDSIAYVDFPANMQLLIDSTATLSALKKGEPFSVGLLDAERTRLSNLFRNNGYYFYSPSYASYLADTFETANRAKLRMQMAGDVPPYVTRQWHIGKITMQLKRTYMEKMTDSLDRRFLRINFNGKKPPIRPGVVLRNMSLRPRQLYCYTKHIESVSRINATGVFSSVDFAFTPRDSLTAIDNDTLDLAINCIFSKPYDIYVETNLKNRTIGRFGPELKVGLTRLNAFRGGEKLDINLHGSYEWQTGGGDDNNSYQYGADASIEFPRTILPWSLFGSQRPRRPRRITDSFLSTPTTMAKASTDIVRRPGYYKMHIVTGEWTYRWQSSAKSRHELSPLTLKYQFMNSSTEKFADIILQNPYLMTTMADYMIPKMRYTYIYSSSAKAIHPIRFEATIEEAGNLSSLYFLAKGRSWNEKNKQIFKNPYSQFIRIEADLTKTWTVGNNSQKLVAHANAGLITTFGNADEAPFSESFYAGGANSVRAFTVRSIGPGAFPYMKSNRQFSYVLQNGDVKLVMNLEYRRQLFGNLHGAIFLDAGNVWKLKSWGQIPAGDLDDEYMESVRQWNALFATTKWRASDVLRQIATGTGLGLRYDLDFLVVRIDWGFGFHAPYGTGKSGYFNIPRFKDMHSLHLAIGYPF